MERGYTLKVELLPCNRLWSEHLFTIRVNDRMSERFSAVSLTTVFNRLRRWLVMRSHHRQEH